MPDYRENGFIIVGAWSRGIKEGDCLPYYTMLYNLLMGLLPSSYIAVEESFNEFVKEFGGELVSELMPPNPANNADYLFRNHQEPVIAELKCLEKDLFQDENFQNKLSELYSRWVHRGLIEPSESKYVQIDTSFLPHECGLDMLKLVKKSIEPVLKKANKQIKATRDYFNLPNAKGLLLLVNDGNYGLEPHSLLGTVGWILEKQEKAGINSVLFFTVNMTTNMPGINRDALLWVEAFRSKAEPVSDEFLNPLRDGWFSFFDRKIGQEIPVIVQQDHSIIERTLNIRQPPANIIESDQKSALFKDIDQRLNTQLQAGKYYWQPQTGFGYYCDSVESMGAGMYLVEGYDRGELVRSSKFYVTTSLSSCFAEVTDESHLDRLTKLYEGLVRLEKGKKMGKVTKQGGATVTDDDAGTKSVVIELYALSLAATCREGENLRVDHMAASSNATTEAEALTEGIQKARDKWPASEGWEVDAQAEIVRFRLELR